MEALSVLFGSLTKDFCLFTSMKSSVKEYIFFCPFVSVTLHTEPFN